MKIKYQQSDIHNDLAITDRTLEEAKSFFTLRDYKRLERLLKDYLAFDMGHTPEHRIMVEHYLRKGFILAHIYSPEEIKEYSDE